MPASLRKYSTLPGVRLAIADSWPASCLYAAFWGLHLTTAALIFRGGYSYLAVTLLVLGGCLLWPRAHHRLQHGVIEWRRGDWFLQTPGGRHVVRVAAGQVSLPWVIYLPLVLLESGRRYDIWLFANAVGDEQWRQLRVRLALVRGER